MSLWKLLLASMVLTMLVPMKASAQEIDVPVPVRPMLSAEQVRILEGIRANDWRAIREAGLSRDRIYLEALVAALPRRRDIPGDYLVQEALAQLGDTQQLQAIWCASIAEQNYRSFNIASNLARIGGWFAIRGFEYLMSPDGHNNWMRALRYQEKNTDVLQASPKSYIVRTLPKLIPSSLRTPEFGAGSEHTLADKWRTWIADHRGELSLLQPTGEGVDYSPTACKYGRPRDRR